MSKTRLYALIFMACFLSWAWILLLYLTASRNSSVDLTVCIFKRVSGLPCPSCGISRAVLMILQGEILQSLFLNPLGFAVFLIICIAPLWIIWDSLNQKASFYLFYLKSLNFIKKKEIAIALLLLVLLNWIWSIYKVQ